MTGRSTKCVFQGVDYVVNSSVNGNQLTIEIEECSTCDQWRNTFDSTYIEDVTFKTGNFKKFSVFCDMVESALGKTSDSVSLDLLTYADLEQLREQKTAIGSRNILNSRVDSSAPTNKRYLIVTYTAEFDRVHYPLPLPYVGKPDPRILQSIIQQLKQDIQSLKQQSLKDYRIKEIELLKRDYEKLLAEKEALAAEYVNLKRQVELTTDGLAMKEIRMLKNVIKNLEEDLTGLRTKNQRSSVRKTLECQRLAEELEEVKASERNLKVRVKSLTNELAQFKRKGSRAFPSVLSAQSSLRVSRSDQQHQQQQQRSSFSNGEEKNFSRSSVRSRDKSSSFERPLSAVTRGQRSLSREDARSLSRDSATQRTNRVSSNTGYSRFNPTAYKAEKERRQREIELKQKRVVRVRMAGSRERAERNHGDSWSSSVDFTGHQRRSSRSPSIGSLRSLASSIDSMSDSGMRSDSSNIQRRKAKQILKSGKALLAESDEWSRCHGVRQQLSQHPKPKILSSTPETVVRSKSRLNGEGHELHGNLDRSLELSEIDQRLSRLQQFMKDNLLQ